MNFIKKWILAKYIKDKNKPEGLSNFIHFWADHDGTNYYMWDELSQIPLARYSQLEGYLMFDQCKLSPTTLEEITSAIAALNIALPGEKDSKKRVEMHTKISALCDELNFRSKYITPKETFYNIIAVCTVREDEDPRTFNSRIHNEKVAKFQDEANKGNLFFCQNSCAKKLFPWLISTEESWTELSLRWTLDQRRQTERLKIISDYKSTKNPKTSVN